MTPSKPEPLGRSAVTIRPVVPGDVPPFCTMAAMAHPGEPVCDPAFVHWKHLESPAGPSTLVSLAGPDGAERGRIWSMPRVWRHRGRRLDARNPVDLVVDERHRSLPVLMLLLRRATTDPGVRGDIVFHTSNPTTGFIYERMMRMEPVVELDAAAWPVSPVACLLARGGRRPSRGTRVLDRFARTVVRPIALAASRRVALVDDVDRRAQMAAVEAFHARNTLAHERSPEWLRWRLRGPGSAPASGYALHWITHRGRTIGWVGTADRTVDGLRMRFVIDIAVPGAGRATIRATWWKVIASACSAATDVLIYFGNSEGNPDQRRLRAWPLVPIPRERVPQRLPLFVHGGGVSHDEVRGGYWVMSDFDMV